MEVLDQRCRQNCLPKASGSMNPEDLSTSIRIRLGCPVDISGMLENPLTGSFQTGRNVFLIFIVILEGIEPIEDFSPIKCEETLMYSFQSYF